MSISLDEDLLSLADAAKRLPRRRAGRPVHVATLYRWATRGYRGTRLEVVRVGSTLCTSVQALQRFLDRLTDADETLHATEQSSTSRSVADDEADIDRQLDELGMGLCTDDGAQE